ncbi:MAG: hypothetical protein COC01_09425, partial [Bacteroidetes bacterium]
TAYVIDTAYSSGDADPAWGVSIIPGPGSNNKIKSELKALYPNPYIDMAILEFFINSKDHGKPKLIHIYDISGKLVHVINISGYNSGLHKLIITDSIIGSLDNGIYFIQLLVNGSKRNTIKLIKSTGY